MIDHTGVTVSDYKKSKLFYENALKPIGYKILMEIPKEHAGGVGVAASLMKTNWYEYNKGLVKK